MEGTVRYGLRMQRGERFRRAACGEPHELFEGEGLDTGRTRPRQGHAEDRTGKPSVPYTAPPTVEHGAHRPSPYPTSGGSAGLRGLDPRGSVDRRRRPAVQSWRSSTTPHDHPSRGVCGRDYHEPVHPGAHRRADDDGVFQSGDRGDGRDRSARWCGGRRLLEQGWRVRALTRNPERKKVRPRRCARSRDHPGGH